MGLAEKHREGHKKVETRDGAVEKMRIDKPSQAEIPSGGQRKGVHISKAGAGEKLWGRHNELVAVKGSEEAEGASEFRESDTAFGK